MFLTAKRMAFLGLLLAYSVILVVLSGIVETSSLFLLAAASFGVGIAIRESGLRFGTGFLIGGSILSFILAPNKFYCFTFTGMGIYLVVIEYAWQKLATGTRIRNRRMIYWIIKFVAFNSLFLPIIIFLPRLIYSGQLNQKLLIATVLGGQIVLLVYDQAYRYFQSKIWGKVRRHFHLE